MTGRKRRKPHWTVWLVYAVIVTAIVSTGTLSRYITSIIGSGSAAIAVVDMGGEIEGEKVNIDVSGMYPGAEKVTAFSIKNSDETDISQAGLSYSIEIKTTGNLPLIYELQCTNTQGRGTGINTTKAELVNNNPTAGGVLPQGESTTHTYALTVRWPSGENDPKNADEVDAVELIVHSEQIMPQ